MLPSLFKGSKHRNREARLTHFHKMSLNQVLEFITQAPEHQKRAISIKLQQGGAK